MIAVRAGMVEVGLFALAAVFARLGVSTVTGVLAYAAFCGLAAIVLTIGWAVAIGLSGWAFLTGFVVNAYGQLTFAPHDLEHLALLLALSAAVSLLRPRSASQRSRV